MKIDSYDYEEPFVVVEDPHDSYTPSCSNDGCELIERILESDDYDLSKEAYSIVLRVETVKMNDRRKHKLFHRLREFIKSELEIINNGY